MISTRDRPAGSAYTGYRSWVQNPSLWASTPMRLISLYRCRRIIVLKHHWSAQTLYRWVRAKYKFQPKSEKTNMHKKLFRICILWTNIGWFLRSALIYVVLFYGITIDPVNLVNTTITQVGAVTYPLVMPIEINACNVTWIKPKGVKMFSANGDD